MGKVKPDVLCPGIRGAVEFLWKQGWETTDSGDGSHFRAGMEGACEEPMIVIVVRGVDLQEKAFYADLVLKDFRAIGINPHVELTYCANDRKDTCIVTGECLRNLKNLPHQRRNKA